jgi:glutamyl-tRNA reductase
LIRHFHILAFTHKYVEISEIGKFHREGEKLSALLERCKAECRIDELVYLSTCNRVEFMFFTGERVNEAFLKKLYSVFLEKQTEEVKWALSHGKVYQAGDALRHLFNVISSIDSLVVGEREIITQVREAFEQAEKVKLAGDFSRVVFRSAIETAKLVFTQTRVAHSPISVVSLAFRSLMNLDLPKSSKILVIGAGQTNTVLASYLKKKGYSHFVVANRSAENGEKLAKVLHAPFLPFSELGQAPLPFDMLLYCTGAEQALVNEALWKKLLGKDTKGKTIVDLSIPAGIESSVIKTYKPKYIGIESLKSVARENLDKRQKEVEKCKVIVQEAIQNTEVLVQQREMELALSFIPTQVKAIRKKATEDVFHKRLKQMDPASLEIVEELLDYLEKKYIGLPMKLAREKLINKA